MIARYLRSVWPGLALLYTVFTGAHYLLLPREIRWVMVSLASATAMIFAGATLWSRTLSSPIPKATLLAGLSAILLWLNCAVHLFLVQLPRQTTDLIIVLVATAMFLLHRGWFITIASLCTGAWIVAVMLLPEDPEWVHFGFALVSSGLMAVLIHILRLRDLQRIECLRSTDEARQSELEERVRLRTREVSQTNAALQAEITERKRSEAAVRESQQLLQAILDNSMACVYVKDLDGRYLLINRQFEQLFHVSCEAIRGKTDFEVFPREQAEAFRAFDVAVVEAGKALKSEEVAPHDGGLHTYISVKCPLYDASGKPYATCGISTDITERKEALERLKESLKEKEALLQEVHHRVKNNMQVISSMLSLQSRHVVDEPSRRLFEDCRNRVKSMALVHDKLYHAKNLATIDLGEHVRDLVKLLARSFYSHAERIRMVVNTESVAVDMDTAIAASLILNELVANAQKHAFADGRHGTLKVSLCVMEDRRLCLTVSDDGPGLPPDLDWEKGRSLGLKLIRGLSRQLHGEIAVNQEAGTSISIVFPVGAAAPSAQ